MYKNIGIATKFIVAALIPIVLLGGLVISTLFYRVDNMLANAERKELSQVYENVLTAVSGEGSKALAMSALVAGIPKVQQAFAMRDRELLASYFLPGFPTLKSEYGIRQFQFHEPPATSFLRVHKAEKFGDDLSGFRRTVVETNSSQKPITGMEIGVAGLGVRGMVPVFYQHNHVGSVEFGMSFGQSFFDHFAKLYGVSLAMHLKRENGFESFASTFNDEKLMGEDGLNQAYSGEPVFVRTELDGVPVALYAHQVLDYSGKPIGVLQIVRDRSGYVAEVSTLRNWVFGLSVLALLVIAVVIWLVSRSVIRPLSQAATSMDEFVQGKRELGFKLVEQGNDEVTVLSRAFNKFSEKVSDLVERISTSSVELGSMADNFSMLAENTNTSVNRQLEETLQVATAMNEMSATVQDVATTTSNTSLAADKVNSEAEGGQKAMKETISQIQQLSKEIATAGEVIQQLEQRSNEIGVILDVIKGIAEQTNLLALNAAIEAARAGEQGRGFAVVADEVRNLASKTQASTEEINQMIEKLQSGSAHAVDAVNSSQDMVLCALDQASKTGDALSDISEAIQQVNDMSAQIASAAEEQSVVTDEINRNIVQINDMTEQTAAGAKQTASGGGDLARVASTLQGLVAQFHK